MKVFKTIAITLALFMGSAVLLPGDVVTAQAKAPAEQVKDGIGSIGGNNSPTLESTIRTGINTFLYIIGALAVGMIIYGGFRYVSSAGDSSAVSSAKNTILYAVVGLVVAMSAYAIANFVLSSFDGTRGAENDPTFDPSTSESPRPNMPYGPTP